MILTEPFLEPRLSGALGRNDELVHLAKTGGCITHAK